jgi:Tol biopolymer transport system component
MKQDEVAEGELRPPNYTRLSSWKEIAAYLGRSVTTVQRWEVEEDLPIHRLHHAKRGSVFAFKHELDSWLSTRSVDHGTTNIPHATPQQLEDRGQPQHMRPSRTLRAALAGVAFALAIVVGIIWERGRASTVSESGTRWVPMVPQPLANDAGGQFEPSLSPDGTHVVYSKAYEGGRRSLVINAIATRTTLALTDVSNPSFQIAGYPTWSPRGDLIAFLTKEADETWGLYVVSPTGEQLRRLATIAGIGLCWQPDANAIAYVDREGIGKPFSVFVMDVRSGARRRLTTPNSTAFGDTFCAFSPNGRQVAVVRHEVRHTSDLFVVDVDGPTAGHTRRLTRGLPGLLGVAWSPDGRFLVVGASGGLLQVPADASDPQTPIPVVGSEGIAHFPAFSRPSQRKSPRLVYQHQIYDVNVWQWHLSADGTEHIRSLPASTAWESFPVLSRDGSRIAYVSNRTGQDEIWIADADGANPTQWTNRSGEVLFPQWSPDGRRLAFARLSGDSWDVYVATVDDKKEIRLTSEVSQDDNPSWSADGKWIYFRSDRSGVGQLWKVSSAGGVAVPVTHGQGFLGFESPDGQRLYFVRGDDVPGLWAMPTAGGREEQVLAEVEQSRWAVTDKGISFLTRSRSASTIQFLSFATGKVSALATLPPQTVLGGGSLSMTADGRTAVWERLDTVQNNLMLIDSWRPY